MRSTIIFLSLVLLAGCATVPRLPGTVVGQTKLMAANGKSVGTAKLLMSKEQLYLYVIVSDLSPGPHGLHLHEAGSCQAPDFKSAKGHLNPADKKHGKLAMHGPHLGDLPNLMIAPSGTGRIEALISDTPTQTLESIFDADGTALVIHAGPDDYYTNPSGDAGSRIACGVMMDG